MNEVRLKLNPICKAIVLKGIGILIDLAQRVVFENSTQAILGDVTQSVLKRIENLIWPGGTMDVNL